MIFCISVGSLVINKVLINVITACTINGVYVFNSIKKLFNAHIFDLIKIRGSDWYFQLTTFSALFQLPAKFFWKSKPINDL